MTSWATIDGRADPVTGDVAVFESTASRWREASDAATQLSSEFRRLTADARAIGFEGEAAQAFTEIVDKTGIKLGDVPPVCDSLADILRDHARKLAALRREASAALARARTAWHDKNRHTAERDQAAGRVAAVQRQIDYVRCLPPEQASGQLQTLHYNLNVEQANHHRAASNAAYADGRVQRELRKWDVLHSGEGQLNKRTADRINGVDLRELGQNLFDKVKAAAGDFVKKVGQVVTAVNSFVTATLQKVRSFLDAAVGFLSDLGFALWVAGLVSLGLTLLVGAPLLLAVGVGLLFAASAVGVLSLAAVTARAFSDLILWGNRATGPGGHESVTTGDLGGSLGAVGVETLSFFSKRVRNVKYLVERGTTRVSRESPTGGSAATGRVGPVPQANVHPPRQRSRSMGGTRPWPALERDLSRIRGGDRGLTSGTNVLLAPCAAGGGGGGGR